MTKCLVIFPPQWAPFSPHLAPVTIAANIRKTGIECCLRDLNLEFYHEILRKDYLDNALENVLNSISGLKEELKTIIHPDKKPEDYTFEEQIKGKKLLMFNYVKKNKLEETHHVINNTESALRLLHDKEAFYDLILASNSIGIINKALEAASLEEFPEEISLYYFKDTGVKLDYKHILEYCSKSSIFSRFYEKKIPEIIKAGYDCIGISMSSSSQFLSSLVLSKMLKEYCQSLSGACSEGGEKIVMLNSEHIDFNCSPSPLERAGERVQHLYSTKLYTDFDAEKPLKPVQSDTSDEDKKVIPKIFMGGNRISRVTEAVKNNPDFFKTFADYVIYEEGERAVQELIEHIKGNRNIEDVSSTLYLDEAGKVQQTEKKSPLPLSELAMPSPEGLPLDKYLLPEIIMPVQLTRGCYWKKCTFCDHYFGQTFNVKDPDKLIQELQTLQEKYGINNFEFTDDCIPPSYLKIFSQKILDAGLKINWYCDLRLENAFTFELLELAYKAGLKMVLWGFESGSKRIMELINKGIDIDNRFEILKRAADAGIYNFAYIFTGFPDETYEEAMETINTVCTRTDIIHAFGTGRFTLGKHSLINSNPEKFGIVKLEDDEEFASEAKFKMSNSLNKQDFMNLDNAILEKMTGQNKNPAWMFLFYRELLFLYIVKYGRDKVLQMKYESSIS